LHHHAIGKQDVVIGGPFSRLALAGLSMAFYFSKCVLPIGLIPIYPRWIVDPPSPIQFLPLPVLAAVIYWFWTRRRSWGRHALLGVGFFLVNLVPFVGFLTGSYMLYTWVMDHVLYIPIIGLIGLAVAGLEQTEAQLSRQARTCCAGFLALVMAVLAVESHGYAEIYINKEALFAYTVRHNLKALPAYLGLGDLYLERGRIAEALFHAGEAVRLAPDSEWAHCNLGAIYFKAGRIDEAMEQFNIAVKINPANASVQTNLASVLAKTGRFAAALEHFNQAIKLQPARSEALVGRGELKRCMGDWIGAVTDLDQALKLDPDSSQARLSRGVLRQAKGDPAGALTDLRHYREVAPKDPNADYAALWIWIIHADQGLKASADQELSAALNLNWNGRPGDLVSQHARFLLGQIDEEQYLADPAVADRKEDSGRVCETWYYAGIKRLLAGTKTPAAAAFRSCLATGKTDFFEYTLAQGELNALNSP